MNVLKKVIYVFIYFTIDRYWDCFQFVLLLKTMILCLLVGMSSRLPWGRTKKYDGQLE